MNQLALTFVNLLDRGWDAYWILTQPLYILVRYVDALGEVANNAAMANNESGSSSRRFVVDKAARQARQAAREQETSRAQKEIS